MYLLIATAVLCFACSCNEAKTNNNIENNNIIQVDENSEEAIPQGAKTLMKVYPNKVKGYADGKLIMANGSTILYDDGKKKDFLKMLDNSDPEDMFNMQYKTNGIPGYLEDAGRSRSEQLFKSMYGKSEAEVRKNLVQVNWFGKKVLFTKVNGAADSLRTVAAELAKLPSEYKKYLPTAGTFNWRAVRGANRLSSHSYGIAIDINTKYSNYWLWENKGAKETDRIKYNNRIPEEIVRVFEKHGFVWGGRWYHYDTMHFEFRPELLK